MKKKTVDIKKLIAGMTLEEKIGQLIQINTNMLRDSKADITGPLEKAGYDKKDLPLVGSTLNFTDAEEMISVQKEQMETDRNKIPKLFMMDVIHGYRTAYPLPIALGSSFDPALVEDCSRMAAREAAAGGVHVTFTPMVDYARDARWGRVMETCGEDPLVNSVMGATQVRAFQGDDLSDPQHIATCVKHFAGYGGAEAGRDYNTVEISERLLREYYLPAYKACIDAGVKMLMPSFNSLNGIPSTVNSWLMKKVLREEWGFDGVVITDYNAVGELLRHGVAPDLKTAAALAFQNGCHIEMVSSGYHRHLKELIEEGTVSEEALDRCVEDVLRLKEELGLFEDPFHGADPEKEAALALCPEHRAIARRAAEECAVLLKNDGVLPFSKEVERVALIGPFGATHQIKGFWACHAKDEETVSVEEGVRALLPNATVTVAEGCTPLHGANDTSGFAQALEDAKAADAVILCLGEPQDYSGEGNSRTDLVLPGVQQQLAEAVIAANPNTAVVLFSGRPQVLTRLEKVAPAMLHMWFPGTEGGNAAARLLFGDANPCGKLSSTFPRAVGQCPIYYNHPSTGRPKPTKKPDEIHLKYCSNYIDCGNTPLYCFGHGLSYTEFVYESLELDRTEITAADTLTVRVTLRNGGDRAGKEVVQLYFRDLVASTVRPVQSLIGFQKVSLAPGERKTVEFKITEPMLRYYDGACNWVSDPGEFVLSTGYADHLILSQSFFLK